MSGAAGGTFGGLEELVKLVKLGIGKKVLGIWNWAFDKNYNACLARTAPRRGRGRRIESLTRIPPGQDFRIMDCGVAGLLFLDLIIFSCFLGLWFGAFSKENLK